MMVFTTGAILNCYPRTPVSARSYRASAFLLDWLCYFCQANKIIHSFIHSRFQAVTHRGINYVNSIEPSHI